MKITNLDPSKYKRFFAFGCSWTNYKWPTWADIIGKDIELYENWGEPGAGNHFIFNSVIEADTRHNFTDTDLVIIFWSTKEREDRYLNNKWSHATASSVEEQYGKEWISKFYLDMRSFLIRDLAYIKASQTILGTKNCDWANLTWNEFFNNSSLRNTKGIYTENLEKLWRENCREVYKGNNIPNFFDDQDVIKLYQNVFTNISGVYRWFEMECLTTKHQMNDGHPTPAEALQFLDWVWPNNTISNTAREYANDWNYTNVCKRTEIIRL